MPDLIYEKRSDGVAVLTFNRPARHNAISPQMMVLLAEAWLDFRDDPAMRVAILTGAGRDAFCVGGDLELLMPLFTGARQPADEWDRRLMASLDKVPVALLKPFALYKPIVAAVNGDGARRRLRAAPGDRHPRRLAHGALRTLGGASAAWCRAAARWCASRARCRTARRWRSC